MEELFEYTTRILCRHDYFSLNDIKLEKGKTYSVGVRVHPLFGPCYYLLDADGKWTTGYFIEKRSYYFKEMANSTHFITAE